MIGNFLNEASNFSSGDENKRWFPPRPYTGILWADLLWLIVIFTLHNYIIPTIFMGSIPFDLITPWLVIIFVVSSPLHATFFWFFASALLETSSLAPKGMYFCAYWIVLSVLLLTRKTLSWKLVAPWLVTFFISSFWLNFFETTMVFVTQDAKQLDFEYFFRQFFEVFITCALGLILARSWMSKFQGERVKGESLAT